MRYLLVVIFILNLNAQDTLKVGVYENYPKIYYSQNGEANGFFPQLLNHIAKKNNLSLTYVPCEWSSCLEMLENGQLDIMPDVAFSLEREERFLFTNETVINNWSAVYSSKNLKIDSLLDLENKVIGGLDGSIQFDVLQRRLQEYGICPKQFNPSDNMEDAFKALQNGNNDVVVVNRFYELKNDLPKNVKKASFIFAPSMLKFAFNKDNAYLIDLFDEELKNLKANKNSEYYKIKEIWFPQHSQMIPDWLLYSLMGLIVLVIVLLLVVSVFKKMVHDRSNEIIEKNKILFVQSKNAAFGEMVSLIAHQWRQPLSIISMITSHIHLKLDLKENIPEHELIKSMKEIEASIKFMDDTINDFRNFYKPNKTKQSLEIKDILLSAEKMLISRIKPLNITITKDISIHKPIKIYENELIHILLILFNNAIDLFDENKIKEPKLILKVYEDDTSYIIDVIDNAGGIPIDLIDKIGEPYFTTKNEKGTGIGIYVAKMILEEYFNGKLLWENIDNGACFSIKIKKED